MKLRINGNSIRLRLGRSEVRKLIAAGKLEDATGFGGAGSDRFIYSLALDERAGELRAAFEGGALRLIAPMQQAHQWAEGEDVGFRGRQTTADGVLELLVEKDFACLHRDTPEQNADAYANPNESSKR